MFYMDSVENKMAYKVFPSTYLRKVVFSVSFGDLTEECLSALSDSLREKLNICFTIERLAAINANRPLFFGTEDHTVEWLINSGRIEISINGIYRSFAETLIPLIGQVKSILDSVERKATAISLEKVNLIPVTLSTYDEMKTHASEVLTGNVLENWTDRYFQKDESTLLYLDKMEIDDNQEFESISGFITKNVPEEDQPSRYILDITARYSAERHVIDILERAELMNSRLFDIFIQSVTPGIIMSMEEVGNE